MQRNLQNLFRSLRLKDMFQLTPETAPDVQRAILNTYLETNNYVTVEDREGKEAAAPERLDVILGDLLVLKEEDPRLYNGFLAAASFLHKQSPGRFPIEYATALSKVQGRSLAREADPSSSPDLVSLAESYGDYQSRGNSSRG